MLLLANRSPVVLRNTKTNKVLKSISLAHVKQFRDRAVDGKNEVESVPVESVLDEVKGECRVGEHNGNDNGDDDQGGDEGEMVDGEDVDAEGKDVDGGGKDVDGGGKDVDGGGKDVDGESEGVCDEINVYVKGVGVGGGVKGVCGSKVEGVGGCKAKGFGGCKVENAGRSNVAQTFDGEVKRLKKLAVGGVSLHERFLDFGPAKPTAKDIWSIIPPQEIPTSQPEVLKNASHGFMSGWLSSLLDCGILF